MKIGILSPSIYMYQKKYRNRIYAPGKLAVALADSLVNAGEDVIFFTAQDVETLAHVVHIDDELLDENLYLDSQQDLPVNAREIVSLYERKKYFELSVTSLAYEYASQGKVDILHVYNSLGNLAHYFVKRSTVPTVFTIHNPVPAKDTLEHWRYNKFKDQSFLSISDFQKKAFEKEFPGIHLVKTIYHGVEIEQYTQDVTHEYYAFIGRATPEKGLDIAINACINTQTQLQIATWFNDVVKQGQYYREKLLPNLTASGIGSVGTLDSDSKKIFLSKAKALILPIQWNEPFGMVMIEAFERGTPVIAYNRGSVSEIVTSGKTGFIVDPSEQEAGISHAIGQLERLTDVEYLQMRLNCRKEAEIRFNIRMMAQNHIKVYRNLLEETK